MFFVVSIIPWDRISRPIIQKHVHILDNCQIMQKVAYKREKNLKELLTRADPYNIINNVDDEMHTYVSCNQRCDSCANFVVAKVVSNVSLQKEFRKLDGLPHAFSQM